MLTENEIQLARHCVRHAMECGAEGVRVNLSKSVMDGCTMFNGNLDKVTHSADRSIYMYLFADGKYGTFSTNRIVKEELEDFITKAIGMVRMLGEDPCRRLPEKDRTAKDAITGKELGLFDEEYHSMNMTRRLENAGKLGTFRSLQEMQENWKVISEECEYSDSIDDYITIDSQGFEGRHTETSFTCFSEITVEDAEGNKFSGHWWEASPFFCKLDIRSCGGKALERAVSQIGPKPRRSGRYRMVVDSSVAARLVSPLFSALNASAIQQKMSFLSDSLDNKVFSEGLTIMDLGRTYGKPGSRLFDTEGVAVQDGPVIENGVVRKYFVNTYMAGKTGMSPTIEDISRPCLMPFIKGKDLLSEEKDLSLDAIMRLCGSGILVTGFNGGNCNPATGDFSFGIEGFAFSRGRKTHPVREMLITGNIVTLWNKLTAAGNDARECTRWQIPTLAFEDVSFSA